MMNITLWGTRGSVPVSGPRFMRHGGSTTCLSIDVTEASATTPRRVVIDCGTGLAELGKRAASDWRDVLMLQTHLHWDHVQGFPFFGPLFDPTASFRFLSVDRDGETLRQVLDAQMSKPTFPVGLDVLPSSLTFDTIAPIGDEQLGELQLRWAEMSHPSGSTAWRLDHRDASFVFSGDVEIGQPAGPSRQALIELARDADVLVMDAQYFPDEYENRVGWGHSTPLDAVGTAIDAGVQHLILTHHDPSHDDDRLEAKLALARERARGTGLTVDNAYDGMTLALGRPTAAAAA
jgi:phosphoribosyl 1,2-cyclic phosphodiesterase